jgi:FlaG/FlaF family flagellin (archaellin)
MVAITVVLASAVYLMVSGYIGSAPSKPVVMSFSVQPTSSSDVFTVISGNITITGSTPLIITITNSSGTQTITLSSQNSWVGSSPGVKVGDTTYYVYAQWTSVTGSYLAAGGSITLTVSQTDPSSSSGVNPLSPGTTVTFASHGTSFYSYTF